MTMDNKVEKPWGYYTVLLDQTFSKVKSLTVKAGNKISLQTHKERDEYWVVVSGKGFVMLNDKRFDAPLGSYIYIPSGCKHRLCAEEEDITIIEVQLSKSGQCQEEDIVRYEDDYNRI